MTPGPNIGRRRHRQRPAQRHYHQHIHHHAGNQKLVVHQAPVQLPPPPRPALPLVPTMNTLINAQRIYSPTTVRSFSPSYAPSFAPTVYSAPPPVPPRQDDSLAGIIACALGGLAIFTSLMGSGSSGNRRHR
jgi:hypothetical protein